MFEVKYSGLGRTLHVPITQRPHRSDFTPLRAPRKSHCCLENSHRVILDYVAIKMMLLDSDGIDPPECRVMIRGTMDALMNTSGETSPPRRCHPPK